jgi:hypothetical protein
MAGIFNVKIDEKSAFEAEDLIYNFRELTKEQIWNEWKSWALYSKKPSMGLYLLEKTNWLEMFPLLFNLVGTPQNYKTHPEGDVWTHTKYSVDEAVKISRRKEYVEEDKLALIFATLCHDLGKPDTTIIDYGEWVAPEHEVQGAFLSRKFMMSIGAPENLISKVEKLVLNHLAHHNKNNFTNENVKQLAISLLPASMDVLFSLIEADASGRPPSPPGLPSEAERLKLMFENLNINVAPLINANIISKMAKRGFIPAIFEDINYPYTYFLIREVLGAQSKKLIFTAEEAVNYVKCLLDVDYLLKENDRVLFLANQELSSLENLCNGDFTETELFSMSETELKKLLISSTSGE